MGFMHIDNLYKDKTILMFRECYAAEKLHGTSAHLRWDGEKLSFFSGGESYEKFVALFDAEKLTKLFSDRFGESSVFVYGEAYGGSQQGMSLTYGKELKFCVFGVAKNDRFYDIPDAEIVAKEFGLDFVHYVRIPATIEALDEQMNANSVQAVKNGCANNTDKYGFCPPIREGIVVYPINEFKNKYGNRVVCKHKRPEFQERKSQPSVQNFDPEKIKAMECADSVANEWVVAVRLDHVLDKLGNPRDLSMTGKVIQAMVEDVMREASGEIVDTKEVRKAIGAKAAKMYKAICTKV